MTTRTIDELERRAYANGDTKNALLLAARHAVETTEAYQRGYDAGYDDAKADIEPDDTDWDAP